MLEFPPRTCRALTAALDALTLQLATHVPLYHDGAGLWRVPLHPLLDILALDPLLEATALLLLHPQVYSLASGATTLAVPLGTVIVTKSSKAARLKRVNNAISARTPTALITASSSISFTKDAPLRSKSRSST